MMQSEKTLAKQHEYDSCAEVKRRVIIRKQVELADFNKHVRVCMCAPAHTLAVCLDRDAAATTFLPIWLLLRFHRPGSHEVRGTANGDR